VGDLLSLEPVRKIITTTSTPSTQCLLDGSTRQCLISTQAATHGAAPCASERHVRRALRLWV
jgi:hypothetical protein